jgi:hypothetical protein
VVRLTIPFKVELKGTATSRYDAAVIDRRLEVLAGRDDEAARAERAFLEGLRAREFGENPPQG